MKRTTLATLALALAMPMLAVPALAQQSGGYGYTPSDEYPYHWGDERRSRGDDRRGSHMGPDYGRGYGGERGHRAYHDEDGYGHHDRYERMGRGHHDRFDDHGHRHSDRGYADPDFRRDYEQDGRRGYYQDSEYEEMPRGRHRMGDRRMGMMDHHMDMMRGRGMEMRERGMMGMMHGGGHGEGRRGMRQLERMMETYDTDGDGRVTQDEVDVFRSERLSSFDRDNDGALTLEEYEALWLDAMRDRMVDRFQFHDDDGDGRVTVDEFSSRTRNIVRQRDRDGDGAFSYGDLGPRGGEEFRRMQDDRRAGMPDGGRPEVEAPLGDEPNEPAGPAANDEAEQSDEPAAN